MAESNINVSPIKTNNSLCKAMIGISGNYGVLDVYNDNNNNGMRFGFNKNDGQIIIQEIASGSLIIKSYFNKLTQNDYSVTTANDAGYVKVGDYSPTSRFINVFCKTNNIMALPFIGDGGTKLYVKLVNPFTLQPVASGTTATVCVVTI